MNPFWPDEYAPIQPSPRQLIARALAANLPAHGIQPGEVERSEDQRCWRFRFSLSGYQAGVEIFQPDYIRVSWAATGSAPAQRIFASDVEAEAFLVALFVFRDRELAFSIPVREIKRRRKPKEPEAGFDWKS